MVQQIKSVMPRNNWASQTVIHHLILHAYDTQYMYTIQHCKRIPNRAVSNGMMN